MIPDHEAGSHETKLNAILAYEAVFPNLYFMKCRKWLCYLEDSKGILSKAGIPFPSLCITGLFATTTFIVHHNVYSFITKFLFVPSHKHHCFPCFVKIHPSSYILKVYMSTLLFCNITDSLFLGSYGYG